MPDLGKPVDYSGIQPLLYVAGVVALAIALAAWGWALWRWWKR